MPRFRNKDYSYRKIGEFKVVHDGRAITIDIQNYVRAEDGVPQLADGKLQLRVACKAHGIMFEGTDKAALVKKVEAEFAKRQTVAWSKWLKVTIARNGEVKDHYAGFNIEYESIERAHIGKPEEMHRDQSPTGVNWQGKPIGIETEKLKSGFDSDYRGPNKDRMILYVEDTPERRAALETMRAKVRSLYDAAIALCGKKGEGADRFLAAVSSSNLLPGAIQAVKPPVIGSRERPK